MNISIQISPSEDVELQRIARALLTEIGATDVEVLPLQSGETTRDGGVTAIIGLIVGIPAAVMAAMDLWDRLSSLRRRREMKNNLEPLIAAAKGNVADGKSIVLIAGDTVVDLNTASLDDVMNALQRVADEKKAD